MEFQPAFLCAWGLLLVLYGLLRATKQQRSWFELDTPEFLFQWMIALVVSAVVAGLVAWIATV